MKAKLITAVFIVNELDANDVKESLKDWFYGHAIGMGYHAINMNSIDLEDVRYFTDPEENHKEE